MTTVDNALSLLGYFSESRPEIGLSEMSRLSGFDKATTRRLLLALERNSMVEQFDDTRKYRVGVGPLALARVREATVPFAAEGRRELERLVAMTGETAHVALAGAACLASVDSLPGTRATRVGLGAGELLPFHATASGYVWLAFAPEGVMETVLAGRLEAHTALTPNDPERVRELVALARERGVGIGDQAYEIEVYGIAAPIFDAAGLAVGTIAVAAPVSRINDRSKALIEKAVIDSARRLTVAAGGVAPACWNPS